MQIPWLYYSNLALTQNLVRFSQRSLQVTHNTTESQLNDSDLAGHIGLCFLDTEANQIVHLPVNQAALACQKPHYSACWVKKRRDGVHQG